jgi:hypothetical protein
MIICGEGRYKVFLRKIIHGEDIILILGGGEKSHVGAIVICEPSKNNIQEFKFEGHYDNIVLKPIAENACRKYNKKIIAIGGIHIDGATKEEIKIIKRNCQKLIEKL